VFFHRFRFQGGSPFHSSFWFSAVSFSGWPAFSKAVFDFNRRRSQGGPLFQMLFWFSSVSGFGQSHFQPLSLTLPPIG